MNRRARINERKKLERAIAQLEAQWSTLGDEVVDTALVSLQGELAALGDQRDFPAHQRKQVTILFMDIVGSTRIVSHLDPEEARDIFDATLQNLAEPVVEHGGHVTRYMGDGFKAVFGAPKAREDDPERAVRAGLGILEVAQNLAPQLKKSCGVAGFQVRVGINTGIAALGGTTEAENTLMGSSINLAARLESAAPTGGLLISHDTYRLVRGVFDVQPLEPVSVKGFVEPVLAYRVLAAKQRTFRAPIRGVEGVETRMVGRESELRYLQDAFSTVIEKGQGRVITVCGEAGVGKSRLIWEFENWIDLHPQRVRYFLGRGRQETKTQPYGLLRDLFSFRFEIYDSDQAQVVQKKIEHGFGEILGLDEGGQLRVHFIGQLLGFDFNASPHLQGVLDDFQQMRDRGVVYLLEYFIGLAKKLPAVIFLEDLHWADDSSLNLVNRLEKRASQQRLLVVCLARPTLFERYPEWGEGQTYHTRLELHRLSELKSRELVLDILKYLDHIPTNLRELIISNGQGNPLYIEELIKMLIEHGVIVKGEEHWFVTPQRINNIEVPPTLIGVLQARLDSLPRAERTLLQQASVVGRVFWDRVLAYLNAQQGEDLGEAEIADLLTNLCGKEIIYRRGETSFVGALEYLFKHILLREATYESVIRRLRKTYHALAADWLIKHSGDRIREYAGLIADHLERAGDPKGALPYLQKAAEIALERYANPEAEIYFHRALAFAADDQQRAGFLDGLGKSLEGQSRPEEAVEVWQEGISLYKSLNDLEGVARLYAQVVYTEGWSSQGLGFARESLKLLEGAPDSIDLARLLHAAGRTYLFNGKGVEAKEICLQALAMAEQLECVEAQADTLATLGNFEDQPYDQAVSYHKEAIALAESHKLLRIAFRAHYNLGKFLQKPDEIRYHLNRAIEIACQRARIDEQVMAWSELLYHIIYSGELRQADEKFSRLEELVDDLPQENVAEKIYFRTSQADLLICQGEWAQARNLLTQIKNKYNESGLLLYTMVIHQCLAQLSLEENRFGKFNEWQEIEETLSRYIESSEPGLSFLALWLYLLAQVRVRQGRLEEARLLIQKLRQECAVQASQEYELIMTVAEGELAYAEGRWIEAIQHWQWRIDYHVRTQERWSEARSMLDLGEAYLKRNETGDREKARDIFLRAADMFAEMGAKVYADIACSLLDSVDQRGFP